MNIDKSRLRSCLKPYSTLVVCSGPPLVRDGPLWTPAFMRLACFYPDLVQVSCKYCVRISVCVGHCCPWRAGRGRIIYQRLASRWVGWPSRRHILWNNITPTTGILWRLDYVTHEHVVLSAQPAERPMACWCGWHRGLLWWLRVERIDPMPRISHLNQHQRALILYWRVCAYVLLCMTEWLLMYSSNRSIMTSFHLWSQVFP